MADDPTTEPVTTDPVTVDPVAPLLALIASPSPIWVDMSSRAAACLAAARALRR
jgi:hypothetical protein